MIDDDQFVLSLRSNAGYLRSDIYIDKRYQYGYFLLDENILATP